ncbi:general transcription factor IIF subunit 2 isoform X1 [Desmodus rotundus]|uniref:general transcription factor IIF subunit 2 isoform X1 n=1 Tax=Desmodus rotundus TaxID=9430 RepID=UPI001E1BE1DD|nr:general transcription factor IIF subunit 2 isoform X1 [Desmodus rotundus]
MAERGELDLTGAKQNTGVWLVKVPKYLSQQWAKAPGRGEVGKLRIAKNQGRTEVSFTLNEDLANIHDIGGKPASVSAPREHPFVLQSVGGQTLTVFTESSSDKLSLEGIVVQRAECRPAASENYMRLKRLQIEESSKPVRLSQQLDKVVTTNYRPVANHQYNRGEKEKKEKKHQRTRSILICCLSHAPNWGCGLPSRLNMKGKRKKMENELELISSMFWTCYFRLLRNINIITLRTWWTSQNSLWAT